MDINTRDFGTVSLDEDALYHFPEGLYGFENIQEYCVFSQSFDEEIAFLYLQAKDSLDPCFLVFEPWDLYPNYAPSLLEADLNALDSTGPEELIFLAITTISPNPEELSLNVKSPVVLNPKTRTGRQVILENRDYPIRFQPFLNPGKGE